MKSYLVTFLFGCSLLAMEAQAGFNGTDDRFSELADASAAAGALLTGAVPLGDLDIPTATLLSSPGASVGYTVSGVAPEEDIDFKKLASPLMDSLKQLLPKERFVKVEGTRAQQIQARRRNRELNEYNSQLARDNATYSKLFSSQLEENGISTARAEEVSHYMYGLQHMNTRYVRAVRQLIVDELELIPTAGDFVDEGYAETFVPRSEPYARIQLLQDAEIAYILSEMSFEELEKQYRVTPMNFHGFLQVYMGLARDILGTLDTRRQTLLYTSASPTQERVEERRRVFSLKYLGEAERFFQMVAVLQPFADVAFELDHKHFQRQTVETALQVGRQELERILREEHGVTDAETLVTPLPSEETVPAKPLTKSQKKRERRRRQVARLLQERQAEEERTQQRSETTTTHGQTEASGAAASAVVAAATAYADAGGTTRNLKGEFRTSPADQSIARKAAAKAAKPRPNQEPQLEANASAGAAAAEATDAGSIKRVPHTPHKNGSKRLRPFHVKCIREALVEGGYTPQGISEPSASAAAGGTSFKLSKRMMVVFNLIHDGTFNGEMNQVTALLRQLGATVDETRSGSRIGFTLPMLTKARGITGMDLDL